MVRIMKLLNVSERRAHPRKALESGAWIEMQSASHFASARDVSIGGLFVQTPLPLPVGSKVYLEFWLEGKPVEVTACVVWSSMESKSVAGMGFEFHAPLDGWAAEAIERLPEPA